MAVSSAPVQFFEVGDVVQARFGCQKQYFPGVIDHINADGTYNIVYTGTNNTVAARMGGCICVWYTSSLARDGNSINLIAVLFPNIDGDTEDSVESRLIQHKTARS